MLQSSALLMALLVSCQAAWCAADDVKLSFPEDRNCGTLSIGPHPTLTWGWADFGEHLRSVGNARGIRRVPRGSFVELAVDRSGATDLSFLNALPADGIHRLIVRGGDSWRCGVRRHRSLHRAAKPDFERLPVVAEDRHVPGASRNGARIAGLFNEQRGGLQDHRGLGREMPQA